ncbi:MAG TPA: ribonuclease III [Anaerolineales bacterium]|nr:ribonuclease III [Anaerolineales bacterium]
MKEYLSNLEHESTQDLAQRLELYFSDPLLLTRALTHRSYLNEHPESIEDNERLEFLGDAVLDFLVGAWLYNRFPEMAEGDLTRLRSALVRTDNLAQFARDIDLGNAMLLGYGESEGGGRERAALLCGVFEALIGAIYLDQGFSRVQKFISPMLETAAVQILSANKDRDPKSTLQEWAQSQGLGTPHYKTVSASGPDHAKIFEIEVYIDGHVYGYGNGHSKQTAAKAAARAALERIGMVE